MEKKEEKKEGGRGSVYRFFGLRNGEADQIKTHGVDREETTVENKVGSGLKGKEVQSVEMSARKPTRRGGKCSKEKKIKTRHVRLGVGSVGIGIEPLSGLVENLGDVAE